MRANLARHARRLLVRRAVVPHFALYSTLVRRRAITSPIVSRQFRRTFLNGLFQAPPREVREPEYEPGWMDIMLWRSRTLDHLRPPSRAELREAWSKLMKSKRRTRSPLNSTQALQCRRLLEYLAKPGDLQQEKLLTTAELSMARSVLLDVDPVERTQNHRDFAKALHTVWLSLNVTGKPVPVERRWSFLVQALAMYGGSQEALQMLYSKWNDPAYKTYLAEENRPIAAVAEGLAAEGLEKELVELIEHADSHGQYDAGLQRVVTIFFASRDRVLETQHWLQKPIPQKACRPDTYRAVASFARRNHLEDWAMPIFVELGQSQPNKGHWDAVLQAILLLGRGLDDVKTMTDHMVTRTGHVTPNMNTINGLLRAALEMRDASLAQDVLSFAADTKLVPNGETSLILLQLRLATEDFTEAQKPFEEATRSEPWNGSEPERLYGEYREASNQYLVALCQQQRPDFKLLLKVLGVIEEGQVGLHPETVALLCRRFLENDQNFDVMDILSIYSFLYSEQQRQVVQDAFLKFCFDRATSTARVWGAYQVLDQYFQDLSFESRNRLMDAFFERKRPDMAVQVLGRMCQHRNKSYRPTTETYIKCFEGFARCPDPEGLQNIHNLVKTDFSVQPSTRLSTALMLAYTGCGRPIRALDFWREIAQSPEGPSYATLEAVFWALEQRAHGSKEAQEIWDRVARMDLEVPPAVYNAYIGAMANGALEKEVRNLIINMASVVGTEPDMMT